MKFKMTKVKYSFINHRYVVPFLVVPHLMPFLELSTSLELQPYKLPITLSSDPTSAGTVKPLASRTERYCLGRLTVRLLEDEHWP